MNDDDIRAVHGAGFESAKALADSYSELRKSATNKIKPFSGDLDTRDLADVSRRALGVREDSYDFSPGIDSEVDVNLKKVAYSAGLHPRQAKMFTDALVKVLNETSSQKATQELEGYKKSLSQEANADYDKIVSDELGKVGKSFDEAKKVLGDKIYDPAVLKLFTGGGDESSSLTTGDGQQPSEKKMSKAERKQKIIALINSEGYDDITHKNHEKLQNEAKRLMAEEVAEENANPSLFKGIL